MNHAEYRELFPQYAGLPDDGVVYGPHPRHKNWYKPQWNASQMLPDQNKIHEPLPRWTSANVIGDLGAYGRYQEAKKLAGDDRERVRKNRYRKPLFTQITRSELKTLRSNAIHAESQTVWTDTALKASVAIMRQGLFAGIGQAIVEGDIFVGIARLGISEGLALGPLAVQAGVRAHRMKKLSADAMIAG